LATATRASSGEPSAGRKDQSLFERQLIAESRGVENLAELPVHKLPPPVNCYPLIAGVAISCVSYRRKKPLYPSDIHERK